LDTVLLLLNPKPLKSIRLTLEMAGPANDLNHQVATYSVAFVVVILMSNAGIRHPDVPAIHAGIVVRTWKPSVVDQVVNALDGLYVVAITFRRGPGTERSSRTGCVLNPSVRACLADRLAAVVSVSL
jgi:hypothetical protein